MELLVKTVQVLVAGSHISAACTASVGSSKASGPPELVPPGTRTLPSGNGVAFICRRRKFMDATNCHEGVALLRSMTSAVAVGWGSAPACQSPPPPTIMILPGRYITDEP